MQNQQRLEKEVKLEKQKRKKKAETRSPLLLIKEIDLLSVETEGYEIEVMLGFDTNKYKPSIICLECMDNNIKGVDGYMKNIGYKLDKRIAINSIYKRL